MNTELNTNSPHCFLYQTEELLIELLGGVRIDGLDRMRVTMKITVNKKHAAYLNNPELAGLSHVCAQYRSVDAWMLPKLKLY